MTSLASFIQLSEWLLASDLEFGFRYLLFSSQVWKDDASHLQTLIPTPVDAI